jgi:hypothetical protein
MNRRTLTTMVLLGLAVATACPQIACAQTDPFLGTWQLILQNRNTVPAPRIDFATIRNRAGTPSPKSVPGGLGDDLYAGWRGTRRHGY